MYTDDQLSEGRRHITTPKRPSVSLRQKEVISTDLRERLEYCIILENEAKSLRPTYSDCDPIKHTLNVLRCITRTLIRLLLGSSI